MNAISIDLVGKLPYGLTELYCCIQRSAQALDIQTLIVGAMARDLVLVHGFDAQVERGTRDVDFGINVGTWREFEILKTRLVGEGFAERSDWDLRLAGAAKLGADAGAIANTATHQYIANRIMQAPSAVLNLANDMARQSNGAHTDTEAMLDTFSATFQQAR